MLSILRNLLTVFVIGTACWNAQDCFADPIIQTVVDGTVGSGNGTLDLRMMTGSTANNQDSQSGFNGDNANTTLPSGNGGSPSFAESYFTTIGEIRAFYNLNFGVGNIDELVVFLDFNEAGNIGEQTNNVLTKFEVVINPDVPPLPDPAGDLSSSQQAAINQIYTGGTVAQSLSSPVSLDTLTTGAGFADYAIFTGINPFSNAYMDSDTLLLNVSMTGLSAGAEEIFLSGEFSGIDSVPEPSLVTASLFLALAGMYRRRRD